MNRYRFWTTLHRQSRPQLPHKRWLSIYLAHEIPFERIAHQCVFAFDIKTSQKAKVLIHPTLDTSAHRFHIKPIQPSSNDTERAEITNGIIYHAETQECDSLIQRINISCPTTTHSHELNAYLPPNIDLIVSVPHGQVEIMNKVEGNISIAVGDGDIRVHKIRGNNVQIKTNQGCIEVAEVVEGVDIQLIASKVSCKRLLAENCDVRLLKGNRKSDFGAVYAAAIRIHSLNTGMLSIGNVHGYMRILGESMEAVDIASVNGVLEIEDTGGNCRATIHFDSCSPGTTSSVIVGGDIQVSLDPTTPIDVEMHGAKIETPKCRFTEHEIEQLDEDYAILTGRLANVPHPEDCSVTSGKINVESRRGSALQTSFFSNREERQNSNELTPQSDVSPLTAPSESKILLHSPCGTVCLQQFDWMKRISDRLNF